MSNHIAHSSRRPWIAPTVVELPPLVDLTLASAAIPIGFSLRKLVTGALEGAGSDVR